MYFHKAFRFTDWDLVVVVVTFFLWMLRKVGKSCWRRAAVKIPFVEGVTQPCTFVHLLAELSRGNNQIYLGFCSSFPLQSGFQWRNRVF